jgi:pimeloyl-ACP methyl ester carboxylesterase
MPAVSRTLARRAFHGWSAGAGLIGAMASPFDLVRDAWGDVRLEPGTAPGDGIDLFYMRAGDGPLMVFLHGFPETWTLYQPYLETFGEDYLAVAPNLRGVHPTGRPDAVPAYAMPHLLEDLHRLLDHFGEERCILVANDWGAYIAWVFASAYPGRVERLVIMNAGHPALLLRDFRSSPAQIAASQYERHPEAEPMPYRAYLLADPVDVPASIEDAEGQPMPDLAKVFFENAARPPASTSLVIRVSTLVIWGMQDRSQLPGLLDGLEDYVDDLTIQRIDEAGHYPMRSHPEEVMRAIRAFLGA